MESWTLLIANNILPRGVLTIFGAFEVRICRSKRRGKRKTFLICTKLKVLLIHPYIYWSKWEGICFCFEGVSLLYFCYIASIHLYATQPTWISMPLLFKTCTRKACVLNGALDFGIYLLFVVWWVGVSECHNTTCYLP